MNKLLIGGGIAALLIAAGAAMAQPAPPPAPGVFSQAAPAPVPALPPVTPLPPPPPQMHMMSGRTMTRDQVVSHVRDFFARLDTNRDGYLTREEIGSAQTRMMGGEQGNRRPDRAAMFDRLDANHDGSISRQEYMAAQPRIEERRVVIMRAGPDSAPGAPGMKMRMHGMGMGFGGRLFDRADSNRDGRVSLAEAQQAALQHFDRADLNRDGTLSREERQQARQLGQRRRPS